MTTHYHDLSDLIGDMGTDAPGAGDSGPLANQTTDGQGQAAAATEGIQQPIPGVATEAEMARLLGITANRVRTLARDGMLHRPDRGRYDVRASLLTYLEDLRSKAARIGPGAKSNPASADLNAEKLRLAKQQADKIEIQNAAARGELVKSGDVERAWAGVLRDVRAALLAVPSRCGAALPHLSAHDISELDREIRAALEALADGH